MSSLLVVQDESASLSPEQAVAYTQLKSEKVLYNYYNSAIFLSLALANKTIMAISLSISSLRIAGRNLAKSTTATMRCLLYFSCSVIRKAEDSVPFGFFPLVFKNST
jgi:hypothetical protein